MSITLFKLLLNRNAQLPILTRVDGDGRGGAALSMKEVTGKPIKLMGVGEKIDELESFHPERIAKRILGMGDIVSLVEKATKDIDKKKLKDKIIIMSNLTISDFIIRIVHNCRWRLLLPCLSVPPRCCRDQRGGSPQPPHGFHSNFVQFF